MNLFSMNEQINSTPNTSASSPVLLPAKRKRGRPRKDGIVVRKGEGGSLCSPPVSDGMRTIQLTEAKPNDRGMVGRIVSGVIDGCFDAGYFLSVRLDNNGPPLRGVIFETGRVTPVSSENDVAPNTKVYQRSELQIPAPNNPQCQANNGISPQLDMEIMHNNACSQVLPPKTLSGASYMFDKQIASANVLPEVSAPANNSRSSSLVEQIVMQQTPNFGYLNQNQSVPPAQNLRMVEQDEMMQVYEVSVQSEGLMEDAHVSAKDWMSESSAKLNRHVGLSPEQCSTFNVVAKENLVMEPKSVIQETTTTTTSSSSEAKQNQLALKDSFHGLHQHQHQSQSCLISAEDNQTLAQEDSLRLQTRDMMIQNEPDSRIFELHDTPIVDQTPCVPSVPSANQKYEPQLHQQTDIIMHNVRNPEIILEKQQQHSVLPTNPENLKSELQQSKLANFDLERQNFGILRDLMAGNHHFVPPEVISDQPHEKFMLEKPISPRINDEKVTNFELKTTSSHDDPVLDNNELHSETAAEERNRESIPFDLELSAAAENHHQSSCPPAMPEIKDSSPAANNNINPTTTSLHESDPR